MNMHDDAGAGRAQPPDEDRRRLTKLLRNVLGNQDEAMVPVQALYDIAGEEWLAAANEAALELHAQVERPEQASNFALVARRPPISPRPS